ncbi:MAG: hypothetical protein ABSF83_07270 [Nitrososphaerales archaeon]|jgi:hypothetical protein
MESADLPLGQVPVEMDTLRIYGFSFRFPETAKLEFNPKFKRVEGDVAVKSPEKANVFVSWGDLEKIVKKAPTIQDHAKFSLDRVKKSVQGKMTTVESKEMTVGGHTALFNHVKIEVPRRGLFGKGQLQEVRSVHLHCDGTKRFFVIYANSTEANSESQGRTMQEILDSFQCHGL